jgi:diaminohydroxyphosphoribosylaminopyrimidine deaminase / 5-amino-6-(5-phosphoribosylamino)uracil reductase
MTQQPGAGQPGAEQSGAEQSGAEQSGVQQSGAELSEAGPTGTERSGTPQPQADLHWLREAIELSRRCPPSESAFSVGAVLVSAAGLVIATGYSRELDPKDHAEEVVLAKAAQAPGDSPLTGATLYSSLEPCVARASRPRACAELIVAAGIPRVVIAWLEPPLFAAGGGAAELRQAGITVDEIPWLAELARSVNAHLL